MSNEPVFLVQLTPIRQAADATWPGEGGGRVSEGSRERGKVSKGSTGEREN